MAHRRNKNEGSSLLLPFAAKKHLSHLGSGAGAAGNENALLEESPFALSRLAVQGIYRF